MFPPATTILTAKIISKNPITTRTVNTSPKTVTPKNTAVTGSNAPRMAVGVEPIYCMAPVVQSRDMAVGIKARANKFPQRYHLSAGGSCMPSPANERKNKKKPSEQYHIESDFQCCHIFQACLVYCHYICCVGQR